MQRRSENDVLLEVIGATAEVMGNQLNPAALMLMAEDLAEYPLDVVLNAIKRCRRELSGRLSLAAIIERIQSADGMHGAEEAWALMSRPDSETVVITEQMSEAMQFARQLLNDGESVAARMAFKEAYTRIMQRARETNAKPRWFVSFGHDPQGRIQPVAEAVRSGKLQLDHALELMSPDARIEVLKLTGQNNHPLILEHRQALIEQSKPLDTKSGLARIAEIKRNLAQRLAA